MKKLLLATATAFALSLTVAPTFAASSHSAAQHQTGGHPAEASAKNAEPNHGASCDDILADPSEYPPATVRACR
jgi:hypothetical protein